MKKMIMTFAIASSLALSLTACASPNAAGGVGTTGALSSKTAYITYLNCVKTKNPQVAPAIDASIAGLSSITDAQWAAAIGASGAASYEAIIKLYASLGC